MGNKVPLFAAVMVTLSALSLYLFQGAWHRGESMGAIVMLAIAVIFWNRAKRRA